MGIERRVINCNVDYFTHQYKTYLRVESQHNEHEEEERGPQRRHRQLQHRRRISEESETRSCTWQRSNRNHVNSLSTRSKITGSKFLHRASQNRCKINTSEPV